jgi:hypothetical protein
MSESKVVCNKSDVRDASGKVIHTVFACAHWDSTRILDRMEFGRVVEESSQRLGLPVMEHYLEERQNVLRVAVLEYPPVNWEEVQRSPCKMI